MSPDGYISFVEILSFDYVKHRKADDLFIVEQEQIDETQKLINLVESNKVFFKDDYERVILLLIDNSEAYREILKRLKHHIEMLKGNTPPWIKEAYWVGCSENQKEFGYGDGDNFDILHFYYLPVENNNAKRDTQIDEILKVITELELNPMEIPEGRKQKIKTRCVDSGIIFTDGKPLFTPSGFEHVWTEANKRELISIKDKKKYLKNQNSP